ncbi:MAG: DUF1330 domain-containing protein [Syntrophaceae bacterium]
MAAYVIVQVQVTDWDKFKKYLKETPSTIVQYGGRYVARGGEMAILEGEEQTKRVVLIEFPSLQKAKEWYYSDEYQQIKILRAGAAIGSLIAIEGC